MNEHKSPEVNELFSALSKAQNEINVASKDSANPFFKSSYANLQSIIEASRPALCKYGLSVIQKMESGPDGDFLVTILAHSSGKFIESTMRINPAKQDVQSLGSYITYLRRYSYAALVGVYDGKEDDDGHKAVHEDKPSHSKENMVKLVTLLGSKPYLYDQILNRYGIDSLEDLKEANIADAIHFVHNQK